MGVACDFAELENVAEVLGRFFALQPPLLVAPRTMLVQGLEGLARDVSLRLSDRNLGAGVRHRGSLRYLETLMFNLAGVDA